MLAAAGTALLAALAAHRDIQPRLRVIERLPQLELSELLKRYAADAPAFYMLPGRLDADGDTATMVFTFGAVVRNVRGAEAAFAGDGIDLGADAMLALAIRAIHGHRIGDCNWNFERAEMEDDPLFDEAGIAAMSITFTSSPIELPGDWAMADLASFTKFHGDIDLPPHAGEVEYQSWLATPPVYTNSRPDAGFDVSLEGA